MHVEPAVNLGLVNIGEDFAPFIEQRHHGLVRHSIAHRVRRPHEVTEFRESVPLLLRYRRSGKGDEAGVWQNFPHAGVETIEVAVLAAMAFIHQHEDVCGIIDQRRLLRPARNL